jgi:hypothetical protein
MTLCRWGDGLAAAEELRLLRCRAEEQQRLLLVVIADETTVKEVGAAGNVCAVVRS